MTETVLYIGGNAEMEGKVLSRDGAVLTVELADGSVVRRHEKNFMRDIPLLNEAFAAEAQPFDPDMTQFVSSVPRKRGRPKKHV